MGHPTWKSWSRSLFTAVLLLLTTVLLGRTVLLLLTAILLITAYYLWLVITTCCLQLKLRAANFGQRVALLYFFVLYFLLRHFCTTYYNSSYFLLQHFLLRHFKLLKTTELLTSVSHFRILLLNFRILRTFTLLIASRWQILRALLKFNRILSNYFQTAGVNGPAYLTIHSRKP